MEIDWITVSAQIVNFLILVWLLKRFLYQPVISAMDRREQGIAERLNDAQQREQQADEQIHRYQDKSDELEQQRDEILATAKEEADQQKKQWLSEAREEADEKRDNWQRQANQEKDEFMENLRRQVAESIQTIARKALHDLADAELEEQVVQRFIEQLKSLDKEARKTMADSSEPVRIASAFELGSAARSRLTRAIHEHLAKGIEVDYSKSPEMLCGIELNRGSQRLGWNLADYMEDLEEGINQAFSPATPEQQAEA
jgi:F-type H+-transporting ATPase subunit b